MNVPIGDTGLYAPPAAPLSSLAPPPSRSWIAIGLVIAIQLVLFVAVVVVARRMEIIFIDIGITQQLTRLTWVFLRPYEHGIVVLGLTTLTLISRSRSWLWWFILPASAGYLAAAFLCVCRPLSDMVQSLAASAP